MVASLRTRALRSFERFSYGKLILVCLTATLPMLWNFTTVFGVSEAAHMLSTGPVLRLCAGYWFVLVLQYVVLWHVWHYSVFFFLTRGFSWLFVIVGLILTYIVWGFSNVAGSAIATQTFSNFALDWNSFKSLISSWQNYAWNPLTGPVIIGHGADHLNMSHVGIQHSIFLIWNIIVLLF